MPAAGCTLANRHRQLRGQGLAVGPGPKPSFAVVTPRQEAAALHKFVARGESVESIRKIIMLNDTERRILEGWREFSTIRFRDSVLREFDRLVAQHGEKSSQNGAGESR